VFDALSAVASVERRETEGGTGPGAVRAQIESARKTLV
jgi:argininosuccinate lyase